MKTDNAKFEIVMNIANTDHSQGYRGPNIAHQVKGPQLNNCKYSFQNRYKLTWIESLLGHWTALIDHGTYFDIHPYCGIFGSDLTSILRLNLVFLQFNYVNVGMAVSHKYFFICEIIGVIFM